MATGEEAVLGMIGALHQAVAEPERWPSALDRVCDHFRGSKLLLGTTPHKAGGFNLSGHRIGEETIALINGPLATRQANPVFCAVPRAPIHRPVVISEKVPARSILKSQVYADALKPSGVRHTMAVVLASNEREALTMALGRSDAAGDYRRDEARLLAALAPHIETALRIRRELAVAQAGAAMLDSLGRGVILAGADGAIRFANKEAERILKARDGLLSSPDGLRAAIPDETKALRRLIFECALASAGQGFCGGGALSIRRPSWAASLLVQVMPAAAPLQLLCGLGAEGVALVFVRDPEARNAPPEEMLRRLWGLTRSEAALALALYDGDSLADAADRLGVSVNTAKTQLKAVFEKIGVSRQSALVREIAAAAGDLNLIAHLPHPNG
jgi:DNA-binding CsgD family transcriptional regulator